MKRALFCLALLTGLLAPEAARAACEPGDCWGAVAIGPGRAFGYAFNWPTRAVAERRARAHCRGRCDKTLSFHNTCAAFATGSSAAAYGWGTNETREAAEERALDECAARTQNCAIRVWSCTQR